MELPSLQDLNPDTIYDVIMEHVDSRLCTYNLHKLDTVCVGLSKEECKAKYMEFQTSFKKYEKVKNAYFNSLREQIKNSKQERMHSAEEESRADEEQVLHDLELLFT